MDLGLITIFAQEKKNIDLSEPRKRGLMTSGFMLIKIKWDEMSDLNVEHLRLFTPRVLEALDVDHIDWIL